MIRNLLLLVLLFVFSGSTAKYHTDSRGAEIHTPFRWVVADSTARVALTVTAQDTQKLCFQIADTTIWMLSNNSPKRWTWVSGKKVDSLYVSGGLNVARATITSAGVGTIAVGAGGIKSAAPCTSTVFNASSSTASRVVTTDANKNLSSATTTTTEVNLLSGKNSVIDGSGTSGYLSLFSGTNRIGNGPAYNSSTSTFTGNVSGSSGSCTGNAATATTATNVSGGSVSATTGSFSSTLAAATLNTGNASIDGTVTATSLQLGTGDLLSVYDTGSFACTTKTTEGFEVQKIGSIRYTIIGDVVTMEIDGEFMGTSNNILWLLRTGMPSHLLPTKETYSPVGMVMDNGVYVAASVCLCPNTPFSITANDSIIVIIPTGGTGAFTPSGAKGFSGQFPNSKTCWTYKK